jgi:hypothetical protein
MYRGRSHLVSTTILQPKGTDVQAGLRALGHSRQRIWQVGANDKRKQVCETVNGAFMFVQE